MNTIEYIARLDPDGHAWEPTDEERRAFRVWVLENFGQRWHDIYFGVSA